MTATEIYFEDLEVGQVYTSPGRTVTETDNWLCTALSGNYHSLHTDEEFAKHTPFSQRVVHGVLGLTMATGLQTRTPLGFWKNAVFLEVRNWKFVKPIFIGDTLTLRVEIKGKRDTRRPEWGVIVTERTLYNQRGEMVQQGLSTVMVLKRRGVAAEEPRG